MKKREWARCFCTFNRVSWLQDKPASCMPPHLMWYTHPQTSEFIPPSMSFYRTLNSIFLQLSLSWSSMETAIVFLSFVVIVIIQHLFYLVNFLSLYIDDILSYKHINTSSVATPTAWRGWVRGRGPVDVQSLKTVYRAATQRFLNQSLEERLCCWC